MNLAARIESLNRVYGTLLLLDENAAAALGSEVELRELDCVVVKGRRETTRLYTLLQFHGEPTPADRELQARYAEAFKAYQAGHWETASASLRDLAPVDGPAAALLKRITDLGGQVPKGWDGVWHLDAKKDVKAIKGVFMRQCRHHETTIQRHGLVTL